MTTPMDVSTNTSGAPIVGGGVEYRCGDCGAKNIIKSVDPVRCRTCGFRVLYKTRTKRCKCHVMIIIIYIASVCYARGYLRLCEYS